MNNSKKIAPNSIFEFEVLEEDLENSSNLRLDQFIADKFEFYSRSFFKNLISSKFIEVNNKLASKSGLVLKNKDKIKITFPPAIEVKNKKLLEDEDLDVKIINSNKDFLVISKPAGLVVHAPDSYFQGISLINKFTEISKVGEPDRPGIVHRLDMHTSGIMLIARSNFAHNKISDKFKNREIKKTYLALVQGEPEKSGEIDSFIMRHPVHRNKMISIDKSREHLYKNARESKTNYKVLKYFENNITLVEVKPETGRMHQIRVHFSGIKCPLIGDTLYGYKAKNKLLSRQALHAYGLEFSYDKDNYKFTCEIPEDLKKLIIKLSSEDTYQEIIDQLLLSK